MIFFAFLRKKKPGLFIDEVVKDKIDHAAPAAEVTLIPAEDLREEHLPLLGKDQASEALTKLLATFSS